MEVELYVFPYSGQQRAGRREDFAQQVVTADLVDPDGNPILDEDKQPKTTKTTLDTDEKISQAFPGGKWHKVKFREKITGADRERIEAMQWRTNALGQTIHQPWRYGRALALTLLKDWTFTEDDEEKGDPLPRTEQGWDQLCDDVCNILEIVVTAWKDTVVPNFATPLTVKSQN